MSQSSHFTEWRPAPKPKQKRFKEKKRRSRDQQLACIKRDGRCRWCGRIDDTLIGHHVTSWGSSGDDSLDNMITLCAKCHTDVGQGYLDARVCNHTHLLRGSGMNSKSEAGWKADVGLLEKIMEENLV